MSSRKRNPRRHNTPAPRRRAITLPVIAVAAVAVAAVAALVATMFGGDEAEADAFDTRVTQIEGSPLPRYSGGQDQALGEIAPTLEGRGRDGAEVVAPSAGRATIVVFVTHWCPHCQRELPVVKQWLDGGGLPADVDLVTVATAMDSSRPNYPPSDWFTEEGWTAPTIADGNGRAATAYGLSGYPFWVAIDNEGKVVDRTSGELTTTQLDRLAATTAGR